MNISDALDTNIEGSYGWAILMASQGKEVVWVNNLNKIHETEWDSDYERLGWTATYTSETLVSLNRNTCKGWKFLNNLEAKKAAILKELFSECDINQYFELKGDNLISYNRVKEIIEGILK